MYKNRILYILENFLYVLEKYQPTEGKALIKSLTNINDILKISIEHSKPSSSYNAVLIFEIYNRFSVKSGPSTTKIYEFESSTASKKSLDNFLAKLQGINPDIKVISQ